MRRSATALGFVLALVIGIAAARAADSPKSVRPGPDEVPADLLVSDLKLGPFYVKPMFSLQDVGVDSNVYLTATNHVKDFTATFVPGVRLAMPVGEGLVRIDQTVSYVYYQDLEDERRWDFDTNFQGSFVLTSLRLDLSERLTRTSERYNVEVVARTPRTENRLEARLGSDHEAGLYFEGYATHSIVRFPSEETFGPASLSDELDHNELRLGGASFLQVLESGRLVLGGELARDRFRVDETGRDSNGFFVYSGLRFEGDSPIAGELDLGFEKLDFERAGVPAFSGFAMRGDLTFEVGEASRLTLALERRPRYAVHNTSLYYEHLTLGARLRVPVGNRFALEAGPEYSSSSYPTTGIGVPEQTGRLTTLNLAALVGVTEGTALRVGLEYRTGRSAFSGADFSGTALTSGFDYGR